MNDHKDRWNCLKNLIRMMCIDGDIADRERRFLAYAARQMDLSVENWNGLLEQVQGDPSPVFPVRSEARALAALKAMLIMAKMDGRADEKEKDLLRRFAKVIGVSASQWQALLSELDTKDLFEPFHRAIGSLIVLPEDFEDSRPIVTAAGQAEIPVRVMALEDFLQQPDPAGEAVCFHAAADRAQTVARCQRLLQKTSARVVGILTRYQGYQVRYLLEVGISRCIIEPVYPRDLEMIFVKK